MTKVLPIGKSFNNKKIVKNARKVPINREELDKMNERLEKAKREYRSKLAASWMAVRKFYYNA